MIVIYLGLMLPLGSSELLFTNQES